MVLMPEDSLFTPTTCDTLCRMLADHESKLSRISLSVSDTGQPITPEELATLSRDCEKGQGRADTFRLHRDLLASWRQNKSEMVNCKHDQEMYNLYMEEVESLEEQIDDVFRKFQIAIEKQFAIGF